MLGRKQLEWEITIDAPVSTVWEVLSDACLLPEWVPAVDEVVACSADGDAVGAVRQCNPIAEASSRTRVRVDTYYTPRSAFYGLINVVVVRRRFRSVVDGLLVGLKTFSEARHDAQRAQHCAQ